MPARRPLIAGNWKMHFTVTEGARFAEHLRRPLEKYADSVDLVVLPPALMLWEVAAALRDSPIRVGAQNVGWADKGAFTGEISPTQLAGWCEFVLIGHSERRQMFCETDETVNRKLKAAIGHRLQVIMAVGETLEENEAGRTHEVITRQVRDGLRDCQHHLAHHISIAYEPVWAIGTGRAASAQQANQAMGEIRRVVAETFDKETAERTRILYGGSVTAANASELMDQAEIDGALVGGASLKLEAFTTIVSAAAGLSI
jgi:triosephosphate isomerase